ncbi:hypothetical protein [Rariglobus hedericola]|uniref:Flagellar biosynthesis anti-sigma factor FlgM n=1 Tax=Rariglobus hedericola TaxID=2597822 RepID=A0A556QPK9_9BACT|nr:hypothetical protein [Rariglobus hedericola]TSJ78583.1 hypothetical protein FPL22_04585 [Rariglobus hedericola]
MIHSTSKSSQPGEITPATSRPAAKPAPAIQENDTLDTSASTSLREALAALPEVRPEAVENAKSLLADPNYPPRAIIEDIARLFVQSQDLSNEA